MKSTGYSTKITTCLFHIKITVSVKKKLASTLWPVLFTLAYFFLYINSPFLLENKFDGGGLSQNMGEAWGSLKFCRKIPMKKFI